MKHLWTVLGLTFWRTSAIAAPFDEVTTTVDQFLASRPLVAGVSVRLVKGTRVVYERHFRGYTSATVEPIASATKWPSSATIMKLVEQGLVNLDVPISTYLPQFTGQKGTMTLRQLFSHTSGLPGSSSFISNRDITLTQAVNQIATSTPMNTAPGTEFSYGGVSMHVGGRIAEVVTGQSWEALFAQRVSGPIGMTQTDYQGLGATQNPQIAGGARTSLSDYGKFLAMLKNGGMAGNVQILSPDSVQEMMKDQTNGLPIGFTPTTPATTRYGFGTWRDIVAPDGRLIEGSDPGAFGFTPWINFEGDYYGIFMVRSTLSNVLPTVNLIREIARRDMQLIPIRLSGNINISQFAGQLSGETLTLTVKTISGTFVAQKSLEVDSNGDFSTDWNLQPGEYLITGKTGTALSETAPVKISGDGALGVNYSLNNGDVDNDNEVGPGDFEIVVENFGSVLALGSEGDLDGDGEVGPGDFEIVVHNFGISGS